MIVIKVKPGGIPVNILRESGPLLGTVLRGPSCEDICITDSSNTVANRKFKRVILKKGSKLRVIYIIKVKAKKWSI